VKKHVNHLNSKKNGLFENQKHQRLPDIAGICKQIMSSPQKMKLNPQLAGVFSDAKLGRKQMW